jgi:Predicted sugar nucleotidyltransferases
LKNSGTILSIIQCTTRQIWSTVSFVAEDQFPEDRDLVISYGDIIYEQSLVNSLLDCDAPLCIIVDREWRNLWESRFDDPLEDAETLKVDSSGKIREIGQEPDSFDDIEGQYVGLLKVRSDYIDKFAEMYYRLSEPNEGETRSGVEMTHFVQRLIDDGWDVQAVSVYAGWLEIDTTDDIEMYHERYQNGTLSEFVRIEE